MGNLIPYSKMSIINFLIFRLMCKNAIFHLIKSRINRLIEFFPLLIFPLKTYVIKCYLIPSFKIDINVWRFMMSLSSLVNAV